MGRSRVSTKRVSQQPHSPVKTHRQRPKVVRNSEPNEAAKEGLLKAENTKKCYEAHVKRGCEWLAEHFQTTTENDNERQGQQRSTPSDTVDDSAEDSDPYGDPMFQRAFERVPNKCSNKALALFMAFKGFHQGLGKSTIEGIRAAFKNMWDNIEGGRYCGKWRFNQIDQCWEGNPAESAEVDVIMRSLKHKAKSENGDRRYSLPMSKDSMDKMLSWSMKTCPRLDAVLRAVRKVLEGVPAARTGLMMGPAERALATRHLEQIAFDSTAWTLWTRCSELVELRWHRILITDHLAVDHVLKKYLTGETLVSSDLSVSFDIYFQNCEESEGNIDGADERGRHYAISPLPHLLGSDCFVWLLVWMKWLEIFCCEGVMEPDDCVFPAMGTNGVVQPREQLSHSMVQKWISEATLGAGILGSFSTNCFRRGGAQYRFMFAPVGERWPLAKVRWWSDWAGQERHDRLIHYLLDEQQDDEPAHSNVLTFAMEGVDETLLGEAPPVQAVTMEELLSIQTSIMQDIRGLRADTDNITRVVRELSDVILQLHNHSTGASSPNTNVEPEGSLPSQSASPPTAKVPPKLKRASKAAYELPISQSCQSFPVDAGLALVNGLRRILPKSTHDGVPNVVQSAPFESQPELASTTNLNLSLLPNEPGVLHHHRGKTGACRHPSISVPMHGLVIPNVPVLCPDGTRRPKSESWRDIVKHWVSGDPELGLDTPLSQWPPTWLQGSNRIFAVKYHERSVIALEFLNTYDSDEAKFLAAFPQAEKGHTALLHAINSARRERGEVLARPRRNDGTLSSSPNA